MHTYNSLLQAIGNFGDRKRRSVGSKNALGLADLFQVLEDFLLQFHFLESGFYNQVAVSNDLICTSGIL